MSTVTHQSKISSRQLVDEQIRATRHTLKLVDLLAGILTLTIGLFLFLFSTALLEHWVIPGGWSQTARGVLFILLIAGIAWYGWRAFWPLLRKSINPIYAAQTLEKSSPTLKNSLLSLLLFRRHRQQLSPTVYQALEQQAAFRLSQVPVDTAVDRSAVLRLGYALVVVVAIFALYRVLSPKNPITSASRILLPWSSIRAPSRVQILDIRPGDTSVARGERLPISAEVHGLNEDEPVVLHYQTTMDPAATRDWQSDEPSNSRMAIPMLALPSRAATNLHWQCQLAAATHDGVERSVRYWIEAGDARSATYQVRLFARPTMVVKRVRYDYPAYTGYPSREVVTTGDLDALEGTRVTLHGLSNQPIQKAFVDFDADGRHDMAMQIPGDSVSRDRARAQFPLTLRPDRRTPRHTSYVLRFTTTSGRSNRHPPKYRIAVTPDYAPEIRLLESGPASHPGAIDHAAGTPEEITNVAIGQQVTIKLEASDPDFALSQVRVVGYLDQVGINPRENPTEGTKRLDRVLLSSSHTGRLLGQTRFTPQQIDLHEGDILVYWAEARDNRTPEANLSTTIPRKVRVTGSQPSPKPESRQQGKPQAEPDRPDADRSPADTTSESKDKSRKNQPQPEDAEGNGENADGNAGDSAGGDRTSSDRTSGGEAGSSQDAEGEKGQNQGNQNNQSTSDTGAASQGAGNRGEAGAEQASADENNPGTPTPDEAGADESNQGQQDSAREKVSPEGDDDGTAFDRLREHFSDQAAEQQGGNPGQQGKPDQRGKPEQPGESEQQGRPDESRDAQGDAQQRQPGPQQGQSDQNQADNQQSGESDQQGKPDESHDVQDQQPGPQQGQSETQQGAQDNHAESAQPRESDPQHDKEATPAEAPGEMSPEQGTAGAGDSQAGDQTTPESQAAHQPRDKQANSKEGNRPDDQQPPSVGRDQQESDSQGAQGGDRTGGGQEGAGGQADTEGTGGAGQHEAADEGGGQSMEPGAGETGSRPGDDGQADGQTGQSTQNQPGGGSKPSGQPGGQPDSQQPGPPQTEGDPSKQQPGEQPKQKPDQQDSTRANPDNSQGTSPAASGGQSEQSSSGKTTPEESTPDEPPKPGGQPGAGSSPQNGGGDGGTEGSAPPDTEQEALEGDAANLEYTRQQTDLILNRLTDQLNRERVDPRLLDKLGWSRQELQRFVNRWKNLESLAAGTGDQAHAAQEELNAALRSLGLRKSRPMRYDSNRAKDNLRDLRDTYRSRIPTNYQERMRAYVKGTTKDEEQGTSNEK